MRYLYSILGKQSRPLVGFSRVPGCRQSSFSTANKIDDEIVDDRSHAVEPEAFPRIKHTALAAKGELVYGVHPVMLALQAGKRTPYRLYVKDYRLELPSMLMQQVLELGFKLKVPIFKKDGEFLDRFTRSDMHQGVCLDCSQLKLRTFDKSALPAGKHSNHFWLMLDHVEDPMNIGALLRTAHFFGIENIVASQPNASPFTPMVNKASSGAMELLNLHTLTQSHASKIFDYMRSRRQWNIVAAMSHNEVLAEQQRRAASATHSQKKEIFTVRDVNEFRWQNNSNTMLVLGNESKGISPHILEHCDYAVNISSSSSSMNLNAMDEAEVSENTQQQHKQQQQYSVGSLNVSACGAVLMHFIASARQVSVSKVTTKARKSSERSSTESADTSDATPNNRTATAVSREFDDIYDSVGKEKMDQFIAAMKDPVFIELCYLGKINAAFEDALRTYGKDKSAQILAFITDPTFMELFSRAGINAELEHALHRAGKDKLAQIIATVEDPAFLKLLKFSFPILARAKRDALDTI